MADESMIPRYRELAALGESLRGLTILRYADEIGDLVRRHRAQRLLDFGCGAGDAYRQPHVVHRSWGLRWFEVELYDPAFDEHAEKPHGIFDGVICCDVLEHVPRDAVDAFIVTLFSHARRFVWASVCCRPAKKAFPDGTNLHVTIEPADWWRDAFTRLAPEGVHWTLVETP